MGEAGELVIRNWRLETRDLYSCLTNRSVAKKEEDVNYFGSSLYRTTRLFTTLG